MDKVNSKKHDAAFCARENDAVLLSFSSIQPVEAVVDDLLKISRKKEVFARVY